MNKLHYLVYISITLVAFLFYFVATAGQFISPLAFLLLALFILSINFISGRMLFRGKGTSTEWVKNGAGYVLSTFSIGFTLIYIYMALKVGNFNLLNLFTYFAGLLIIFPASLFPIFAFILGAYTSTLKKSNGAN